MSLGYQLLANTRRNWSTFCTDRRPQKFRAHGEGNWLKLGHNFSLFSYAVRKELKRTRFAEYPTYINDDSSARRAKNTNNSFYKPNERHQAIVSRVKTPMPMPGGSVLKKKSSSMLEPAEHGNETMGDSASDREEANVTELLQAKRSLGWEMVEPEKSPTLSRRSGTPKNGQCGMDIQSTLFSPKGYLYTVTVITGNRWAADTEADLFVVLHSADSSSEKFWLRQEVKHMHGIFPF